MQPGTNHNNHSLTISRLPRWLPVIYILLLVLWPQHRLAAQSLNQHFFDSLESKAATTTNDKDKLTLLVFAARRYPFFDPNKGRDRSKDALWLARKCGDTRQETYALLYRGINEISAASYDTAHAYFMQARALADDEGYNDLKGIAMRQIGVALFENNDFPDAMDAFFDALAYQQEQKNDTEIYVNLEYIGRIYEVEKQFEKAQEYYQKSYDYAARAGDTKATARNLVNMGQVYQYNAQWPKALACYQHAGDIFKKTDDASGVAIVTANMAIVYTQLHRYTEALTNADSALRIYTRYSDLFNLGSVYGNIARIYLALLQDSAAPPAGVPASKKQLMALLMASNNKARDFCEQVGNAEGLYGIHETYATAYQLQGNYPEAYKHFKQYIHLRDSVFSTEQKTEIARIEATREIARKDGEIKLKQLDISKRRNENILLSVALALVLGLLLILYRKGKVRQKLNETISQLAAAQEKT
ncbi:MAG: tetratricopeptide repeat protein, partial [Chitinophagia bacterium]|nr:tetratricopeptide repeat protein [Chitinophagia bacterium]